MSGGALNENVGFPSASGWQTTVSSASTSNHVFDFLFAHFSIFVVDSSNILATREKYMTGRKSRKLR
jgi:hypothetical protein